MKKFHIKVRRVDVYEAEVVVEAPSARKAAALLADAEAKGFLEADLSVASDVRSTHSRPLREPATRPADYSWDDLTPDEQEYLSL